MSTTWPEHLPGEAQFWRVWLTDDRFRVEREKRLKGRALLSNVLVELAGVEVGETIRILDVGSGPISTVGVTAPSHPVELTCVDALADDYNELLKRCGFTDLPAIKKVKAEDLSSTFGEEAFNLVICANALDHFEAPERAFSEMFRVCCPGGSIVLTSVKNEGERQNYGGLHQWNLVPDDDGLWLWNQSRRANLIASLPIGATCTWEFLDIARNDIELFRAVVTKAS